jgi:diaminohydroxyphosphoribosylaminopyrimidine deaminase/5-amino-6-(5-phosphoribosylamino)uracil reductase
MTLDGKIAVKTGDSKWISCEKSREYVHGLRHLYDGIMVGVNTVISDNPELTDRSSFTEKRDPVRIITDSAGRIPLDSKVLRKDNVKTIIAVTERIDSEFVKKINDKGEDVIVCPDKNGRVDLNYLMKELWKQGIDSILIEGGSTLNYSAVSEGVVDKVVSFISPKIIGGKDSFTPVGGAGVRTISDAFRLKVDKVEQIDTDILIESYIIR